MSAALQRLQHELQRTILSGVTNDALVCGTDESDRAARLGIYVYAYRSRLHDALVDNFPMLQVHLGSDEFAMLARGYIDVQPSRNYSIRTFGSNWSEWLKTQRPDEPWLSELAAFEWALGCAFDAPNEPPLSCDALSRLAVETWPTLTFRFAPCVRHLTLETNAPQLYDCAARGISAVGRHEGASVEWLIWRQSLRTHYRSLSPIEALALTSLLAGRTFANACERLLYHCSADDVPTRAAACLKRWLADGLIVGLGLSGSD